jgi:hypothetical protein
MAKTPRVHGCSITVKKRRPHDSKSLSAFVRSTLVARLESIALAAAGSAPSTFHGYCLMRLVEYWGRLFTRFGVALGFDFFFSLHHARSSAVSSNRYWPSGGFLVGLKGNPM